MRAITFYKDIYYILYFITVILYIVGFLGIWSSSPKYLSLFDIIFKIFISVMLIYYFNPLNHTVMTQFHKELGFSAGIALFTSFSLHYIKYIFGKTISV